MLVLALLLCLHGGTREEKKAFIKGLVDANEVLQDRLDAAYLVWRQRKCWMWGGGYFVGALLALPREITGAGDQKSFAALIPD